MNTILILVDTLNTFGGTQKVVCDLSLLLSKDYKVVLCTFDRGVIKPSFPYSGTLESLKWDYSNFFLKLLGYFIKPLRLSLLKIRSNVHITISNLPPSDLISILSLGSDFKICLAHHPLVDDLQNHKLRTMKFFAGIVYKRFDRIVAVNDDLKSEYVNLFAINQDKASTIHNFLHIIKPRQLYPVEVRRNLLIWVGRLTKTKNLDSMISIFNKLKNTLPEYQLIVIGDGPCRYESEKYAESIGLTVGSDSGGDEDILFLGNVDDISVFMAQAKIFVLTSRAEGFGLVILEAMHNGLPVICSDCPTGGPNLILSGANDKDKDNCLREYGVLLPVPSVKNLTVESLWIEHLLMLLNNPKLLSEYSNKSLERVLEFNQHSARKKWLALLSEKV